MSKSTTTTVAGEGGAADAPLTFLDLFSGCGGFSLGLEAAGMVCKAAVDFNEAAIETFKANHKESALGLVRDLTKFSPKDLDRELGGSTRINVIVGGPPCQGFSKARMVDGSNHGGRLVHDEADPSRWRREFQPRSATVVW